MSEVKDHFDILIANIKEYVNTNIQLVKLKATDKSSAAVGGIAAIAIVAFIMMLFLIFVSTALAILISNLLDSPSSGYFIIAGLYLLIGILLFVNREQWIINPIGNAIIKAAANDDHNENSDNDGSPRYN